MNDAAVHPGSAFRGRIGVARTNITPPPGIYARNWAAAIHDIAEGVHRPLTLTALTLEPDEQSAAARSDGPLVLISADLMSWRSRRAQVAVLDRIAQEAAIPRKQMMFCLTHTHAAPSIRPEDAERPGGQLIAAYLDHLTASAVGAIRAARTAARRATLTWRYGRCDLATNRDFPEPSGSRIVCGFNPNAPADDSLLVGRVTSDDDEGPLATIVNYACHPTTLAWQNKLISPDYVGAMRELVESHTAEAPCLFLQGASGELAPAEQYTGDVAVADRHGSRLGFAVLATLEAMGRPATHLAYEGVVESGAPLAVWKERADVTVSQMLTARQIEVTLPLKPMPSLAEFDAAVRHETDPVLAERLRRQRAVREIVGEGDAAPMPLWIWRVGAAVLAGQPNEAYSPLQTALRAAFAPRPIAVMNLVNGSAGYLPPATAYGHDIYQVRQSPFARGGLERLIETATESIHDLLQGEPT